MIPAGPCSLCLFKATPLEGLRKHSCTLAPVRRIWYPTFWCLPWGLLDPLPRIKASAVPRARRCTAGTLRTTWLLGALHLKHARFPCLSSAPSSACEHGQDHFPGSAAQLALGSDTSCVSLASPFLTPPSSAQSTSPGGCSWLCLLSPEPLVWPREVSSSTCRVAAGAALQPVPQPLGRTPAQMASTRLPERCSGAAWRRGPGHTACRLWNLQAARARLGSLSYFRLGEAKAAVPAPDTLWSVSSRLGNSSPPPTPDTETRKLLRQVHTLHPVSGRERGDSATLTASLLGVCRQRGRPQIAGRVMWAHPACCQQV